MQPTTPKLLEDIRDAAAFIREVAQGRTVEDYGRERIVRQAIERNFEIIGEAMNLLAHGYDLVEHRLVWSTIDEQVPVLLHEVETLLGIRH